MGTFEELKAHLESLNTSDKKSKPQPETAPSRPQCQKRKHKDDGDGVEKPSKRKTKEDPKRKPTGDPKETYLRELPTLPHNITPPNYVHGPRDKEHALLGCPEHAALVCGKLEAHVRNEEEVKKTYASASEAFHNATKRMRDFEASVDRESIQSEGAMDQVGISVDVSHTATKQC